jgi:putative DNA primase/helicase
MGYTDAGTTLADAEARREQARQLFECFQPCAGTPAELYWIKTRRLPAATIAACADLYYLPAPIEGRPPVDHAAVALLRDVTGEVSGFELSYCDIAGAAAAAEPRRQTYALREHGVRDGLFHAGGGESATAWLTEGYGAKALAVAALGLRAYGAGSRVILGCAPPPEAGVVLVPDRRPDDKAVDPKTGRSAAGAHDVDYRRAIDLLTLAGKTVRLAAAPDCEHSGGGSCKDADDVLRAHGPVRLKELLEDAADTELSLDGEARRLAQIDDPLERDQAVKAKAAELKVGVALLRDRVAHYRERMGADAAAVGGTLSGDAVVFEDVQPWHAPVDGAGLVADLIDYISAHAQLPEHAALTCALWVLHCHAHGAAYHSPRLVLRSPTKGCGKSTARRTLSRLVPKPFEAVSITGPTLFRPIGQWSPTVFLDEANELDWRTAHDLIAVITSGHCVDDPGVPRCVGPDFEVRVFRVWAPLCIALIGFLPSPIAERSIVIEMAKKRRTATVRRLVRRDLDQAAAQLARRAARWTVDHRIALESADPELPPTLGDRPADNWRPLLAIADLIGLGTAARTAALGLAPADDDGEDLGVQLLADIRQIFDNAAVPKLSSAAIVGHLIAMEERPWAEFGRARRPITTNALARMLRPFKIRPGGTIRTAASTAKGYYRATFEQAWSAYSLLGTCEQPPHRHNAGAEPVSENSQPTHVTPDVAVENPPDATNSAIFGGVAVADGDGTPHGGNGVASEAAAGQPVKVPKPRRFRIRGADTTPTVEGL